MDQFEGVDYFVTYRLWPWLFAALDMCSVPRPTRYFSLHYLFFRFLGLGWWHHPDEGDTRNFPGWYLYYSIVTQLVWVVGFVALESIDPFIGEKDLDRFMFSLSFVITHDLTLFKLCIFYFKNNQIQEIVRTLEVDLYNFYQNNRKNQATLKITRILTASFVFFGWITILNADVYGTIRDSQWKAEVAKLNDSSEVPPRTLPQAIYTPWKYQTDLPYYLTCALENVGLLWTGHIVLTTDTFIGSLILFMSTQFDILREALVTAYDRTIRKLYLNSRDNSQEVISANNDDDDNDDEQDDDRTLDDMEALVLARCSKKEIGLALEETFKSCFRQHQVLVRCVEKFADTYSYGFLTQLLSSTAAICVVMVQVSQDASSFKSMKLATSLAFFMAMIVQLAIQCFTGNELTSQSTGVADAVMECKWERTPPSLQRMLVLVMMRAQRPLRLSAAGFAYMNNDCFVAIMKAAYSYYAVLSQKAE